MVSSSSFYLILGRRARARAVSRRAFASRRAPVGVEAFDCTCVENAKTRPAARPLPFLSLRPMGLGHGRRSPCLACAVRRGRPAFRHSRVLTMPCCRSSSAATRCSPSPRPFGLVSVWLNLGEAGIFFPSCVLLRRRRHIRTCDLSSFLPLDQRPVAHRFPRRRR